MAISWENIEKKVKAGIAFSSKKIEEYSQIGKLKMDILSVRRTQNKLYRLVGETAFKMIEEENNPNVAENEQVKSAIEKIKNAMQMLADLEAELANATQKRGQPGKDACCQ